jgi:hypothetical protein
MFEQLPESAGMPFALKILGGLLLGVIASCFGLIVVYMLAGALTSVLVPHSGERLVIWTTEILDIVLFVLAGYSIYRQVGRSALARGMLIGVSLVFLLNAICGVAMLTSHGSLF